MENSKIIYLDKVKTSEKENRLKDRVVESLNDLGYLDNPAAPSRIDISIKLDKSKNNKKTEIFIKQAD